MGNEVYSLYELAIMMIKTGFKAICTSPELSYDAFDDYLAKNEIEAFALNGVKLKVYEYFFPIKEEMEK